MSINDEECHLIEDLFRRVGSANNPRDAQAESVINDAVRTNPSTPYYLVQEEALKSANQKIIELQARIEKIENARSQEKPQTGGFLSGLGSLFNSSQPLSSPSSSTAPSSPRSMSSSGTSSGVSGPWGQSVSSTQTGPAIRQGFGAGGGFLASAMSTAAGVAGGVLLAEGIMICSLAGITLQQKTIRKIFQLQRV